MKTDLEDLVRNVREDGLMRAAAAVDDVLYVCVKRRCRISNLETSWMNTRGLHPPPTHSYVCIIVTWSDPPSMYSCTMETVPSVGFTYAS